MNALRRLFVCVTVGVLLAQCIVSIGTVTTVHGQGSAGVLRIGLREPTPFDPQAASDVGQIALIQALFRGLLRYDKNGQPAPSIAVAVPTPGNGISADGLTYTYKLKHWRWSDGKCCVTAQDFVYSFQRLHRSELGFAYSTLFNDIIANAAEVSSGKKSVDTLGVKAIDDITLQFTLVRPTPYFNTMIALWVGSAVRKDSVERAGLSSPDGWTDPANGEVVGSGPFRITKWEHGKRITFERNPNYDGEPAKLDRVELVVMKDATASFAAYKQDELDMASFPPAEFNAVQQDSVLSSQVLRYRVACVNYLGMNNAFPPFDNKKVRVAFSLGLDRDQRIKDIDRGQSQKALSWLPEGVAGYDPKLGTQYDFNPQQAKQTLADAGYPDGKGLPEVAYNYIAGELAEQAATWYRDQYKKVLNVEIKLNPLDLKTYRQMRDSGKMKGLFEYGWCADYLHPSNWLQIVFGTGQGNNLVRYSNPQFDLISKQADAETNPEAALALYRKAHELLIDDEPVIFMQSPTATRLVKPRVVRSSLISFPMDGGLPGSLFWELIEVTK